VQDISPGTYTPPRTSPPRQFPYGRFQWLNYSEVGGGTLYWPKLQCYTKTTVTKTKYHTPIYNVK